MPNTETPDVLYFGCRGESQSGHHLYHPGQRGEPWPVFRSQLRQLAIPFRPESLDGVLPPRLPNGTEAPQGVATLVHLNGWTVLSFWDRTGDNRPNSNSNFLLRGVLDFGSAVERARAAFPRIWERFTFTVQPFEAPHV